MPEPDCIGPQQSIDLLCWAPVLPGLTLPLNSIFV
jgi:hypothetical protein